MKINGTGKTIVRIASGPEINAINIAQARPTLLLAMEFIVWLPALRVENTNQR